MEKQELEQKTQKELITIARQLIRKGHFRLAVLGNESREWLINAILDMQHIIDGK